MKNWITTFIQSTPILFAWALRIAAVLNIVLLLIIEGLKAADRKENSKHEKKE